MVEADDGKGRLPAERWFAVVRDAPLVSIDLVIRDNAGRVLMGWRSNEPARNTWFVPGGAIRKNETLDVAFNRVARTELGLDLQRSDARLLGVYEHHYASNFANAPDVGTHYIVLAHAIDYQGEVQAADAQHAQMRWFAVHEALDHPQVHAYSKAYLR